MSRVCTICTHPARAAIDTALVAGEPVTTISHRYSPLSASAISRHRDEHLPQTLAKAEAAQEMTRAADLLAQVDRLKNKAISLLLKAEAAGDLKTALRGVAEARNCLELLLEVEGEIDRRPAVNILMSGEWLTIRTALIETLRDFPEARFAVAARLTQIEGGNGHHG